MEAHFIKIGVLTIPRSIYSTYLIFPDLFMLHTEDANHADDNTL
jgi:hypothetical protein